MKYVKTLAFGVIAIAVLLSVCFMPAVQECDADSGSCGDNLTWTYAGGTLTIEGSGPMTEFDSGSIPWKQYKDTTTTLNIAEGVTTICARAFQSFNALEEVAIPNSVKTIGHDAFSGCRGLTTITVGEGLTKLSSGMFSYCTNVTQVNFNAESVIGLGNISYAFSDIGENTSGVKVVFGNNVKTIPSFMFYGENITQVIFGNSLESIGDSTLQNTSISSVTFPSSLKTIGKNAFSNIGIESVTIPDSVKTIGEGAFRYCSALKTITIGEGVETLDIDAFGYCPAVTSIKYNAVNAEVSHHDYQYPFKGAGESSGGMAIVIGGDVTTLGENLFRDCYATDVTVGKSVKTIGKNAFNEDEVLTNIVFECHAPLTIGKNAFALHWGTPVLVCDVTSGYDPGFLDAYAASGVEFNYITVHGKMFTVNFLTNCPTSLDPMEVEDGYTFEPPYVGYADHRLVGWYKDSALTDKYDFSTPVTGDMTLYASWAEAVTYTVTLETNGGTAVPSILLNEGDRILENIPDTTRDGYRFTGWYLNSSLTDKLTYNVTITSDIKLYAGWEDVSGSGFSIPLLPLLILLGICIVAYIIYRSRHSSLIPKGENLSSTRHYGGSHSETNRGTSKASSSETNRGTSKASSGSSGGIEYRGANYCPFCRDYIGGGTVSVCKKCNGNGAPMCCPNCGGGLSTDGSCHNCGKGFDYGYLFKR